MNPPVVFAGLLALVFSHPATSSDVCNCKGYAVSWEDHASAPECARQR